MKADLFSQRHLGPRTSDLKDMLDTIGVASMDELISKTIPKSILRSRFMDLPEALDEHSYLERMREIAARNQAFSTDAG